MRALKPGRYEFCDDFNEKARGALIVQKSFSHSAADQAAFCFRKFVRLGVAMVSKLRITEHRRDSAYALTSFGKLFCFGSRTRYVYSCEHSLSFIYEPTSVLKFAIKVAPQKLNIARRASADINHRELLSARRRGLTRV